VERDGCHSDGAGTLGLFVSVRAFIPKQIRRPSLQFSRAFRIIFTFARTPPISRGSVAPRHLQDALGALRK
jgi:hypothetical protein